MPPIFSQALPKGERKKQKRTKATKIWNTEETTMSQVKFNSEPVKPDIRGYNIYHNKIQEDPGLTNHDKMVKTTREDWKKMSRENKAAFKEVADRNKNDYKQRLLDFVANLDESQRLLYLGFRRVPLYNLIGTDIFEEYYPNEYYPVYKTQSQGGKPMGSRVKEEMMSGDETDNEDYVDIPLLPEPECELKHQKGNIKEEGCQNSSSSESESESDDNESDGESPIVVPPPPISIPSQSHMDTNTTDNLIPQNHADSFLSQNQDSNNFIPQNQNTSILPPPNQDHAFLHPHPSMIAPVSTQNSIVYSQSQEFLPTNLHYQKYPNM